VHQRYRIDPILAQTQLFLEVPDDPVVPAGLVVTVHDGRRRQETAAESAAIQAADAGG
jgi:hypothetical protein